MDMLLHSPLGKLDAQPGEAGKVNFLTYRGKQEARRPEQALLTLLKRPLDTKDKRPEPTWPLLWRSMTFSKAQRRCSFSILSCTVRRKGLCKIYFETFYKQKFNSQHFQCFILQCTVTFTFFIFLYMSNKQKNINILTDMFQGLKTKAIFSHWLKSVIWSLSWYHTTVKGNESYIQ